MGNVECCGWEPVDRPPKPIATHNWVPEVIAPSAQVGHKITRGRCHFQWRIWRVRRDNFRLCPGCRTFNYFAWQWA